MTQAPALSVPSEAAPPEGSPVPRPALAPRGPSTWRTIVALMLREMSTTYGRSALGYLWAILEPVAGIMLMSVIFSLGFRAPGIGTSFALFFATGILPFVAYMDISQKTAGALKFSRKLLFYPGVTFIDAVIARFIVNALTQTLVFVIVLIGILWIYQLDAILDPPAIALGFVMAFSIAVGVGMVNCYLLALYPIWERAWAILNRPMFIISCIFFLFDSVPQPYQDWLWWNPLIHVIGQVRSGVYATYDATYVSTVYVFGLAGILTTTGLLLLRRHHRDIVND